MPQFNPTTMALIACMLASGVTTTILAKYQDMQCIRACSDPDPARRVYFQQPLFQTIQMFTGEMGCWLVILLRRRAPTTVPDSRPRAPLRGRRLLLLALPAMCDITSSTLLNASLFFVSASIYQMSRGTLVLFVALLAVLVRRRTLGARRWVALWVVVVGVGIVGVAGARSVKATGTATVMEVGPALKVVLGMLLIATAQLFTAGLFTLEEYILERYSLEALKVVGWEGLFGFSISLAGAVLFHFAIGGAGDAVEGWREMRAHRAVAMSSIAIIVATGCFNFVGITVARRVSATARSTVDCGRTLGVWMVSLLLRWESFKLLQAAGFLVLVGGLMLFSGVVGAPDVAKEEAAPLLEERAEEVRD
ncbi:integral membrane protein-like protein [Geopyxis carbonaria]|nr:integral membrane protein-like protein [Geopyxis carbonaria]